MHGSPLVTKDGVTVAEHIELRESFANMGAQMVLESAVKTGNTAGDGTTTATVLAHVIYREGTKLVAAGYHPLALKRGIDRGVARGRRAARQAVEARDRGERDVAKVATVSANGDAGDRQADRGGGRPGGPATGSFTSSRAGAGDQARGRGGRGGHSRLRLRVLRHRHGAAGRAPRRRVTS